LNSQYYIIIQPEAESAIESRQSAIESKIDKLIAHNFKNRGLKGFQSTKESRNKAPESGFEPESEPRQFSNEEHNADQSYAFL